MNEKPFIIGVAIINFLLFLGKAIIAYFTHSIALFSDAINSLTDTINTVVVFWATKIAKQGPDKEHPAGHGRALPLAGFFIAIMTAVLGFEVIQQSLKRLLAPESINNPSYAFWMLLITIGVKGCLSFGENYLGKKYKNSALRAMATESRGDVLIAIGAIIGIYCNSIGITWADPLAGLCIGLYVFYTAYEIATENIDYLMGASGSPAQLKKIKEVLKSIPEVQSFHELKTQHLGEKLQVTVHCDVEKPKNIQAFHDLEEKIYTSLESLDFVEHAFIHLDPIKKV